MDPLLKKVWCKGIPSKVSSFFWKALRDRAPSRNNLVKKGIIVDNRDKFCILCYNDAKDIDHLLCSCSLFYDVWRKFFGWFEIEISFFAICLCRWTKHKKKIMIIGWQCDF